MLKGIRPQGLCLTAITFFFFKLQTFILLLQIPLEFESCYILFFKAARPEIRRYFLKFRGTFIYHPSSPCQHRQMQNTLLLHEAKSWSYWLPATRNPILGFHCCFESLLFSVYSYILQEVMLINLLTFFPCFWDLIISSIESTLTAEIQAWLGLEEEQRNVT